MDISVLTTKQLEELLLQIREEINKRKQQEKLELLDRITQIATKHGYSLEEITGNTAHAKKNQKVLARKPVPVKYRHPKEANLTWTGRGRRPQWVTVWLAGGGTLEALTV